MNASSAGTHVEHHPFAPMVQLQCPQQSKPLIRSAGREGNAVAAKFSLAVGVWRTPATLCRCALALLPCGHARDSALAKIAKSQATAIAMPAIRDRRLAYPQLLPRTGFDRSNMAASNWSSLTEVRFPGIDVDQTRARPCH
jgi:hypothetical protein